MTQRACVMHPDILGEWTCDKCGRVFCDQCVEVRSARARRMQFCPVCGQWCSAIEAASQSSRQENFFGELPGAFAYPLRGRGKYVILGGAVCFGLLGSVRSIIAWSGSTIHWYVGGIIGLTIALVTLIVGCIVPAYMLEIIFRSISGEDEPPDWPEVTGLVQDLLRPAYLFVGVVAVSFFPAAICRIALLYEWVQNPILMWVWMTIGVFYLPMALAGVALSGGAAGSNPLLVVSSIVKIGPAYLVACVILAGVLTVWVGFLRFVRVPIPLLGPFLAMAVSLYLLILEMRIIGLMCWSYEEKLGRLRQE